MRAVPKTWLLTLMAVAALGCGGDSNDPAGPGNVTQADLVGSWNITSIEFRENAPGSREFDAVEDGGATATMTIDGNGDYTLVITESGVQETQTGNFEVTSAGVVDTSDGEELVWQFNLDASTLTGQTDDGGFDFDQDGSAEESATISVTLLKVS